MEYIRRFYAPLGQTARTALTPPPPSHAGAAAPHIQYVGQPLPTPAMTTSGAIVQSAQSVPSVQSAPPRVGGSANTPPPIIISPAVASAHGSKSLPTAAGGGARAGGDGRFEVEPLAGESVGGWPWWLWVLLVLVVLAVIGLLIWWIVSITMPRRPQDITARDVNARDIAASGNVTITGNLTVLAGTTKASNVVVRALSMPPTNLNEPNVVLDGTESSITLTNQSGSIVTVTLPSAAENLGLVLAVFNETANSVFHVNPYGTDTIEGSNATAVENSSALFVSVGLTPSGLANWKQIF